MLSAALTPNQARLLQSRGSAFRAFGLRWTWVSMIAGITVLPARLTRVAPAGTATPWPAWTILLPSMTSVAVLDDAAVAHDESCAFSNAVTSARAGPARPANDKRPPRPRLHSLGASKPPQDINVYAACLAI